MSTILAELSSKDVSASSPPTKKARVVELSDNQSSICVLRYEFSCTIRAQSDQPCALVEGGNLEESALLNSVAFLPDNEEIAWRRFYTLRHFLDLFITSSAVTVSNLLAIANVTKKSELIDIGCRKIVLVVDVECEVFIAGGLGNRPTERLMLRSTTFSPTEGGAYSMSLK
ncbi:unnamed protein product [Cylicocyclus nassatus]|uniref:Uncharacterized protein n=1 Tax=Cylicocyclus nassatus TaxID=53992 RepID=A0AA36DW01_CYLNA|nr:unnamed protein product [Cylicocyclus nassatus]